MAPLHEEFTNDSEVDNRLEVMCAEAALGVMPVTARLMKPGDLMLWSSTDRTIVLAADRARLAAAIAPPDQPTTAAAYAAFYDGMLEQLAGQFERLAGLPYRQEDLPQLKATLQSLATTIRSRPKRVRA